MAENKNLFGTKKVAVIGVGFVGSSIAYAISIRNIAKEIVLIDIDKNKVEGEALDIAHGISYMGTANVYAGDYSDCADCDLIIITAGRNRRPGETRINLINDNIAILKNVVDQIKAHYTRGSILLVANPVDILTYKTAEWMGLPNGKVFGSGCLLDTSRLIASLSKYLSVSTENIKGDIIGEHGDTQIPAWSHFTVGGIPLDQYCKENNIVWNDDVKKEFGTTVAKMGATIIGSKGKTHYGIATSVCAIADAVLTQRPMVASVSSTFTGEYGIENASLSVPSIIGVNGVERRLIESYSETEIAQLHESAKAMIDVINTVENK